MKEQFPEFFPLSEDERKRVFSEGLIVPDSSFLLNLYEVSEIAREKILRVFKKLNHRLWIPFHVVEEVLAGRERTIENKLSSSAEFAKPLGIFRDFLKKCKEREVIDDTFKQKLDDLLGDLQRDIDKKYKIQKWLLKDDPILAQLMDILQGRIGEPFNERSLMEVRRDGKQRFEAGIPPGFADAGKVSVNAYGDYEIWVQILEHAERLRKPVCFITSDVQKRDWTFQIDGIYHAHPMLVREFTRRVSRNFVLLDREGFSENIAPLAEESIPAEDFIDIDFDEIGEAARVETLNQIQSELGQLQSALHFNRNALQEANNAGNLSQLIQLEREFAYLNGKIAALKEDRKKYWRLEDIQRR